jgi:hypothetical protein
MKIFSTFSVGIQGWGKLDSSEFLHRPEAEHEASLIEIHSQRAAMIEAVIPEPLGRTAFMTFAGAARRFQIAVAVMP